MAANPGSAQWIELERAGMAALDEFMETFNSGSPLLWAQSLHYPHVRLGGLAVQIWNSPEALRISRSKQICSISNQTIRRIFSLKAESFHHSFPHQNATIRSTAIRTIK